MEPTNNQPAPGRLTEEEHRAALAHDPLTSDELQKVISHKPFDALVAYRRAAQSQTDTPDGTPRSFSTRTLRAAGATLAHRGGMSPQQIAQAVTGHRGDTTGLHLRRHDSFHTPDEDTGVQ